MKPWSFIGLIVRILKECIEDAFLLSNAVVTNNRLGMGLGVIQGEEEIKITTLCLIKEGVYTNILRYSYLGVFWAGWGQPSGEVGRRGHMGRQGGVLGGHLAGPHLEH